ncbi:MAG: putative transcription factor [Algoriphagus marincola HL-49]|uniref:Putative transcription factor n=1 Tax=Algoriphagus marincola HL-49 TaxID=1305737 RepID=A0A0P8C853_9BACT|nr:MAG: putative transcription factor [Algoriphagus marincola HL-49]
MTDTKKSIKDISVQSTENWMEKVAWRKANKVWLRKSADIALRILDALEDLGWNKARLAEEMGVSPQQVSKYVKGEENFKLETICNLEKALGVDLITILQADEEVSIKSEEALVNEPKTNYSKK